MMGTNRIDCASVFIKKTPPICMFSNTVSFLYGIEIVFDKKRNLNTKMFGELNIHNPKDRPRWIGPIDEFIYSHYNK